MFGSAGNIFGLIVVKSYRRHDFNHPERRIPHDRARQLLASNVFFDDEALAIGPVLAGEFLRRGGKILAHDEKPNPPAPPHRLGYAGRRPPRAVCPIATRPPPPPPPPNDHGAGPGPSH